MKGDLDALISFGNAAWSWRTFQAQAFTGTELKALRDLPFEGTYMNEF